MATGPEFQLYGDPDRLQDLADTHMSYKGRFDGILERMMTVAGATKENWSGAGQEQYGTSQLKHSAEYQSVQAQFHKMASMTSEAGGKWQQTISFANSKF